MKLHPQNPTPGEDKIEPQRLKPTPEETLRQVVEILEILSDGLNGNCSSYYYHAVRVRLEKLKKDL